MLLQLENATPENINRLLEFAGSHNIKLELVDDANSNYYLPGTPLSAKELQSLVKKSRNSGTIRMQEAHDILSKAFNAD
jgi:hypothetical protein